MNEHIFQGLNDEQAAAVAAVRGAVCILAGAGSGKTTTITRRIANQVATETFDSAEILAVTFTDKAAREMAARLQTLRIPAVRARTFHAEALAEYRKFSSDGSEIVPSKAAILAPLIRRLPMPHRFTAVRDVATEIEWAKNRCITPDRYRDALDGRKTPVPEDLMAGIYASYERRKERAGQMDFEDLLTRLVQLLATDTRALGAIRARYRSFTVDEYQDVNLLQQSLLEAWVGERDDLCVVGDDYQSIFGFTGATPGYLIGFPERYPAAHVVRLTANYRSSPQILSCANRLVPRLGGVPKTLRATRDSGPEPVFRAHGSGAEEVAWIVGQARALRNAGVPWEEIAVLYRINGRSEDLEEALSRDRVPYQVRDGAFLRRPAARAVLSRLRRTDDARVAEMTERVARALGWLPDPGDDLEEEEVTRQADLGRLVTLAQEFPGAGGSGASSIGPRSNTVTEFIADLQRRFAPDREGRGVQILTYHRAKGLEFDAVFLPRLEDKELPFALSTSDEDVAEERRLLYVGITRARTHLFVSWSSHREGERRRSPKPSPFLAEIRPPGDPTAKKEGFVAVPSTRTPVPEEHVGLFVALKDWRLRAARAGSVPAYVVFHDETLARIAEARPKDVVDLGRINGIGPAKIARYGPEVLELVATHA